MSKQVVEKCSCLESEHLRVALAKILEIASQTTQGDVRTDLIAIATIAHQGACLAELDITVTLPQFDLGTYVIGNA